MQRDSGIVLSVDETQLAERVELAALGAVLQRATSANWPVVVALAGLPTMRNSTPTYFERAVWHDLDLVSSAHAELALSEPARDAARPMEADAARALAAASGGYRMPCSCTATTRGVHRPASAQSRCRLPSERYRELERGLYANRWTTASPSQQQYMTTVAALQNERELPTGRAVADGLDAPRSSYRGPATNC